MQAVTSRDTSSSKVEKNPNLSSSIVALALVSLVVLATVLAYSPVLFDFFLGDDFVHLTWLKDAVKNPELIWRNFHSSWLDGTTTRFYRPLISVFMVTDYLGWGINGLGFHITNVLFHLTATVFIFFLARHFLHGAYGTLEQGETRDSKITWLYPLGASLIYGLYPLHTEAVSWITGRVDAVVTAFYTAAFYFYIRWRKGGGGLFLTATAIAFALGLLSKEMALTLPPAFMLYEALLGPNAIFRSSSKPLPQALFKCAIDALKPSLFFWAMVAVYFGVRRYALGTFVGGYDDSLFFIADLKHFVLSWLHGLRMFLIPLNKGLMGAHHWITHGWEASLILISALLAINVWTDKRLIRLLIFNGIFLAFCFAPVYKIFGIGDDLQGARLAHVATLALSLLLAMAFIVPQKKEQAKKLILQSPVLRTTLCAMFSIVCFAALWTNNQAWSRGGQEANAIRAGLKDLYAKIDGDPQVLLLSLPDEMNGSYICRNAVWGMTKAPQLQRDIWNCLSINKYEQIFPFGFLKDSLYKAQDKVQIYSWNSAKQTFQPLVVQSEPFAKTIWTKGELKSLATIKTGEANWAADGSLQIQGNASKDGRPEILLDFGKRSSWDIDFVAVSVRNLDTTGGSTAMLAKEGMDLLYTNDVSPEFILQNRTHADFVSDKTQQTLVLPLHNLPEWALGGQSHHLMLKLPHSSNLAIDSIEVVNASRVMPHITFTNSGYMGTKGYLHLSEKDKQASVSVDASGIPGAEGVVLEVTRTNLLFETQNTNVPSKVSMKDLKPTSTVSGDIELRRDMFPNTGMYELRPWAVDKSGNRLGVAGDHIVISVDS